jgi:hypothetical protein
MRRFFTAVLLLLASGCGGGDRKLNKNPVRLTLTNRSGRDATGVMLRFDREIARADRIGDGGFFTLTLRLAPADALRAEGGTLKRGERMVLEVLGRGGPPRVLEGRWITDGKWGATLGPEEFELE